jgi:hypothetical protein
MSAVKFDNEKPRMDLLDTKFLLDLAAVMGYGAIKYEANNWRRGMRHGRYFAAMMRHAWAYWGGEENDQESGLPHLAHAAACIMMLMGIAKSHPELDDRWVHEDSTD